MIKESSKKNMRRAKGSNTAQAQQAHKVNAKKKHFMM